MNNLTPEAKYLLHDIVSLFEKYDAAVFHELIDFLSRAKITESNDVILGGPNRTRRRGVSVKSKRLSDATSPECILKEIIKTNPARADLLSDIHRTLLKMSSVMTIKELRAFCQENTYTLQAKTKSAAINEFLLFCTSLGLGDLQNILDKASKPPIGTGSSLEQWTDIILPNK